MACDLARRIVEEAEAMQAARALTCRFVLRCDLRDVHTDELLIWPEPDGLLTVQYRSLHWRRLPPHRAERAARMAVTSMFHEAADAHGQVEYMELQLFSGGQRVMRLPWARCAGVEADDLAAGDPDADAMFDYLWACASLAVQGLEGAGTARPEPAGEHV